MPVPNAPGVRRVTRCRVRRGAASRPLGCSRRRLRAVLRVLRGGAVGPGRHAVCLIAARQALRPGGSPVLARCRVVFRVHDGAWAQLHSNRRPVVPEVIVVVHIKALRGGQRTGSAVGRDSAFSQLGR